jgi:hypothetical protein
LGKYKELGEANLPDLSTTPVNYYLVDVIEATGNRQ